MRTVSLFLLISMLFYACENGSSDENESSVAVSDLDTPCGCLNFMHKNYTEASAASVERRMELEEMYQNEWDNCRKVIAVFKKDELRTYTPKPHDPQIHIDDEDVEEAILSTDYFKNCEELAIKLSHRIGYSMKERLNPKKK